MSSAQNSDADREDYVVSVLEFAGDPGSATAALQRVFGLSEPDARKILTDVPVAVRRGVNRIRAEYFRRALELSGARVEVRDGDGEVVAAQTPGRVQASGPVAGKAQPTAAKPIAAPSGPIPHVPKPNPLSQATAVIPPASLPIPPAPSTGVQAKLPVPMGPTVSAQSKLASPNATIVGTGPLASPPSAAMPLTPAQSGKTLALGGIAANDLSADPVSDLRIGAANDAGPVSARAGGWGDLEPRKPRANRAATQKVEPPPSGFENTEPPPEPSSQGDDWALSLGDEPGPLDSPLESPVEDRPVELASMPTPGQHAPRRSAEGPPTLDFDENTLGPSLDLKSDPRNLQRESAPRYDAIPKGEHWKAPGMDTLAKARRKQDFQAQSSGLGNGRGDALHLKAGQPDPRGAKPGVSTNDRLSDARSQGRGARGRPSTGDAPFGDDPSGIHSAARREPFVSPALARPSGARHVDLGFWEATKLGFSGTSISWIAKIAGANVVLAGLAQLSVRVPALGLPLLLIGLTCLLGLCSEYHRYVFWAAATREDSLRERPALSVAMMMRDGVHLTGFALISQLLVWFWLASQLHAAHTPLAIVFSPSMWVLGFGPGFYWPIALACAAAQNRATGVWDLPLGLRVLGRAPGEVAVVVLATAAAFMISMMIGAVIVSATSLDPTLALFTAAGLPVAITHALAGAWMGRVVHQHPDLFE